jgi:cellulose synthase/poly-beta-1,6-N-acetylglucosamine synthase-like glycosyltransferase
VKQDATPFISIVCPVRNADRTIAKTFEYFFNIDYPQDRFEIIIADGGSTDETVAITKKWAKAHPQIVLVEVPNCVSPGFARNAALKIVKGEYILFTDGDCAPEKDWVTKLLNPFKLDPKIGIVGGEILTLRTDMNNFTESYCEQVRFLSVAGRCGVRENGFMPEIKNYDPHEVNGGDWSPFFATANLAISKKALQDIGAEFWHEITGEDVDFCIRVQSKGYKLYFAVDAVVKHMHRVSLESYLKQWHGYGYGHPLLIQKHARNRFEIILQYGKKRSIPLALPLGKGIMHIGDYHLMHFFGLLFILGLIACAFSRSALLSYLTLGSFLLGSFFLYRYFRPCFKLKPGSKFFSWCKIRYLTNRSFIKGASQGSKKFGPICIEGSW